MFSERIFFLYNLVIIFFDTILFSSFLVIDIVVLLVIGTENFIIEFSFANELFSMIISIWFPIKSRLGFPYFLYSLITVFMSLF